ncbi:hypothetical protein OK016_25195 [Vibrio chagasii]|nr:hypothetical protein [Vibrio chagasii]
MSKIRLRGITASVDDGGDGVLNSFEIQSAKFFGIVQNVGDGQTVNIRISEQHHQRYQVLANGSQWHLGLWKVWI